MKTWQIYSMGVLFAISSAIAGYILHQLTSAPSESTSAIEEVIGSSVPDISLADTNGLQRQLSDWQGKVLVVNFWATWCPPCREEIPVFIELQNEYEAQGLQFLGVALHSAEEILDFMVEQRFNYPSLVGSTDVIALGEQLGNDIGALPYTVVVDREGIIRFTHRGALSKEQVLSAISGLM
ncbi:MAG: TlpA disulfide reductase family protein [Pseudomonadota bacterium]